MTTARTPATVAPAVLNITSSLLRASPAAAARELPISELLSNVHVYAQQSSSITNVRISTRISSRLGPSGHHYAFSEMTLAKSCPSRVGRP